MNTEELQIHQLKTMQDFICTLSPEQLALANKMADALKSSDLSSSRDFAFKFQEYVLFAEKCKPKQQPSRYAPPLNTKDAVLE